VIGQAFWRQYARHYDALTVLPSYHGMLDDAITAAALAPGMRVLDAGCGTGNLALAIRARGLDCRVVGVDNCPEMLTRARDKGDAWCAYIEADLDAPLPFLPASFDAIIGCNSLYALRDAPAALARLAALLKPGRRMVQTVPRYGFNPLGVLRGSDRRALWRQAPALLALLAANLFLCGVSHLTHPLVRLAGHRRLRHAQEAEFRAYLSVEACALTISDTYAGQNWLLRYEKQGVPCPV
jgi:SAM-dependent methyltransferase